jgi:hypothetical protein
MAKAVSTPTLLVLAQKVERVDREGARREGIHVTRSPSAGVATRTLATSGSLGAVYQSFFQCPINAIPSFGTGVGSNCIQKPEMPTIRPLIRGFVNTSAFLGINYHRGICSTVRMHREPSKAQFEKITSYFPYVNFLSLTVLI